MVSVKLMERVKFLFKNNMDDYIRGFMSGSDLDDLGFGDTMDSSTALKYTAVFACNKVLAETFACMPAMLYRKDQKGEREAVNDLAIYDILHNKPNEEMSPFNFKEACMTSLNLGGNSVCEKLVNGKGQLVGLYPYQHTNVDISRNQVSKKLVYTIRDGISKKELTRDQVFHVPNLSLDGIVGLSPISYAASAIRLGMSYEQFGVNFYRNGANPSGSFDVLGELGEEAFNRLKKELKLNYTGLKRTGTPMLLEGGMKFTPHTINPVDAQLLESKSFQAEDICRIYRVPQHLIQLLGHSTNNNIEHQSLEFVMYTMLPIFKRFEENINMQLSPLHGVEYLPQNKVCVGCRTRHLFRCSVVCITKPTSCYERRTRHPARRSMVCIPKHTVYVKSVSHNRAGMGHQFRSYQSSTQIPAPKQHLS